MHLNKTTEKYSSVFNGLGLLRAKPHLKIRYEIVLIIDPLGRRCLVGSVLAY